MGCEKLNPQILIQDNYLKEVFTNFFLFSNTNSDKFTFEYVRDALIGALSELNFDIDRLKCLENLYAGLLAMAKVTQIESEHRRMSCTDWSDNGIKQLEVATSTKSEAMNLKEVVAEFGLPMNNIKDKKWRDAHDFPYLQYMDGGKVTFYRTQVQEWIDSQR